MTKEERKREKEKEKMKYIGFAPCTSNIGGVPYKALQLYLNRGNDSGYWVLFVCLFVWVALDYLLEESRYLNNI